MEVIFLDNENPITGVSFNIGVTPSPIISWPNEKKENKNWAIVEYGQSGGIRAFEINSDIMVNFISDSTFPSSFFEKKENLYITAIRNFLRKENFSELNQSLLNEQITEDEFEKQLDEYEDKYVIVLKDVNQDEDVKLIAQLVEKIGYDLRDFSVGDISEMFSLKEDQLISKVNLLPSL